MIPKENIILRFNSEEKTDCHPLVDFVFTPVIMHRISIDGLIGEDSINIIKLYLDDMPKFWIIDDITHYFKGGIHLIYIELYESTCGYDDTLIGRLVLINDKLNHILKHKK